MMLASDSTLPMPLGNTRSPSLLGQASFHSLRVLATNLPKGTTRSPAADLGLPISLNLSARCRTCSSLALKSTSFHRSPRSSEARRPVKIAVIRSGRQRPLAFAMMALISVGRRDVHADLELALLTLLGVVAPSPGACCGEDPERHYVRLAPVPEHRQERAQASDDLADHRRRSLLLA